MVSQMVDEVLKAEERAKQSEQQAGKQVAIIHEQAQQQAGEIIQKEIAAANAQADKILQDAESQIQGLLSLSQKELEKELDELQSTALSRWSAAVEQAMAVIIPRI